MRIDRLLWYLRFAKTRAAAQAMAQAGHIRVNGRRVERAHQSVSTGDRLVVPLARSVRVIELAALPLRRGPAIEAQACYRVLDASGEFPIAPAHRDHVDEGDLQP